MKYYVAKSEKLSKNVKLIVFSHPVTKCFRFGFRIYTGVTVPYVRVQFLEGLSHTKLPLQVYSGLIKEFKILCEYKFGEYQN